MTIKNLKEAEELLYKYIPKVREILGKDMTLDRMDPLMKILGNPEKRLNVIHIAGTSGKTSTTYYISKMLVLCGKKVGTTVSPHIDKITERIQINGEPIPDYDFCTAIEEFELLISKSGISPSYFEYLIAFIFWYFDKVGVDYAVIETGLGGLQDCTNVAKNKNKFCVITDIGYDHMNVLGNKITEIASQKAGIIWGGNIAIKYHQSQEIDKVFMDHASMIGAEINLLSFDAIYRSTVDKLPWVADLPSFQSRNLCLAYRAVQSLAARDDFIVHTNKFIDLRELKVPGRMDTVVLDGKTIIMDGAHNEQKMKAFVSSFKAKYPDTKAVVLFSVKEGKEFLDIIPILKPIIDKVIITKFSVLQDRVSKSVSASTLYDCFVESGISAEIVEDYNKVYSIFKNKIKQVGVITGSFFLIANVRQSHPELRGK